MKITKHISFYYILSRIKYINSIIDETNKYELITDIYIHTNVDNLDKRQLFTPYNNGTLNIIYHDLTNIHPYYLTWKCRDLMKHQKKEYDIFMYIEDDILVPWNSIKYWFKYYKNLLNMNYNLGFLRIENFNNTEYCTDLPKKKIKNNIILDKINYAINNINPYCAFWIYDKDTFNKFIDSKYYDINNIGGCVPVSKKYKNGLQIRESSAFGLHCMETPFFKNTLIPIINNKLINDCKIYHLPNNYINKPDVLGGTIQFSEALEI